MFVVKQCLNLQPRLLTSKLPNFETAGGDNYIQQTKGEFVSIPLFLSAMDTGYCVALLEKVKYLALNVGLPL